MTPRARIADLTLVAAALVAATGCDETVAPQARARSGDSAAAEIALSAAVSASPSAGGRVQETTFDDLKFEMESNADFRDEMITSEIAVRFGREIRIRGYMFPTLRKSGLTQFVLVRDNLECCFGPGAALYDCVLVYLRPGVRAEYSVRPVTVEGTFRFEKMQPVPDGPLLAIYRLDDAIVP